MIVPTWTQKEQFRLLAYLLTHPKRAARPEFAAMLLLKRSFFPDLRAQWLALHLVLCGGDVKAIERDALKESRKWFQGFLDAMKADGFSELPENVKEVTDGIRVSLNNLEKSKKVKIPPTPPTSLKIKRSGGGVGGERSF